MDITVREDTVLGLKGLYVDTIRNSDSLNVRTNDRVIAIEQFSNIIDLSHASQLEFNEAWNKIQKGCFHMYTCSSQNLSFMDDTKSFEKKTIYEDDSKNLSTTPIAVGKETTITIAKGTNGLGLSIVGGADTVLGEILIHEVYKDGAAALDGRLRASDKILEVDGKSLRHVTHEEAISILRRTQNEVKMIVYRAYPSASTNKTDDESYNIFDITLMKKPNRGLGLSIVERRGKGGVFISDIVKGGVADNNGHLSPGDRLLRVNGKDLRDANQEDAATLLKTSMGKVTLTLGRLKSSPTNELMRGGNISQDFRKV